MRIRSATAGAQMKWLICTLLVVLPATTLVQSLTRCDVSRRQAFLTASAATSSVLWTPADRATASIMTKQQPQQQQQPTATLVNTHNNNKKKNTPSIPCIGYSLYKTPADQVEEGVKLALAAGVRHFDVATQYGTNAAVGTVLQEYIQRGREALRDFNKEPLALAVSTRIPPTATQRRQELWVTHKVSNAEQSLSTQELQTAVLEQRRLLLGDDNDEENNNNLVVMLHSPLTDRKRRVRSYAALQDLQTSGQVAAVGVCHFGVALLNELVTTAGGNLSPPAMIQLELSPFHRHADVTQWAANHGSLVSCAAWSRLSSTAGPVDQWQQLGALAAKRGVTKQQVLIRWAYQSGYLCVPRSSAKYKVERAAIYENAWPAIHQFALTRDEMEFLNTALDVQLPIGQLGVVDGWETTDIVNETWDPTLLTA